MGTSKPQPPQPGVGAVDTRLRAVLDKVLDAYAIYEVVTDDNGRYADSVIAYTNLPWRTLFLGYDARDIEGRSVYEVLPHLRARSELHARTFDADEPFQGTLQVETPRGLRWVELNMSRSGGSIVAYTRDITAQRETEAALVESREMLRQSLDAIIDGYAIYRGITDASGRFVDATVVYANETWRRQFSADEPEVEGRSLYTFPGARNRFEVHQRVFETGEPFRGIVSLGTGEEARVLDLQMVKFDQYIVGSSRDITEQRAAEAKLAASERRHREVISGIDAFVWDDDLVTGDYFISPKVEELTGYPSDLFSMFEFWSEAVHPDDRSKVVEAMIGEDDADIEYRMRVADGSWRWFRDRLRVVRDPESGRPVRRYGLTIDVDDRRGLEERVRHIERLSAVGQLAANVSHDFDNVLYGISMFAGHLLKTHPDAADPVHEDADAIARAVTSAQGLTRSLLAFAREQPTTTGRVVIDERIKGLEPMLGAVVGSRVKLVFDLHAEGFAANGDPAALEQAILNLCINARDAMPGGGTLTLETQIVTLDDDEAEELDVEPGRGLILNITDTGTGMDEEIRSQAFLPYFTTKEVGKGTGLGLATVFGTIKAARGGIRILSTPGVGTTIRLFLVPAEAVSSGSASASSAAAAGAGSGAGSRGSRTAGRARSTGRSR